MNQYQIKATIKTRDYHYWELTFILMAEDFKDADNKGYEEIHKIMPELPLENILHLQAYPLYVR